MIDRHSESWSDVRTWAEKKLTESVEQILMVGLLPEVTEHLRGQVVVLRALLALPDQAMPPPSSQTPPPVTQSPAGY
ncbi:MAG: hypothetical protein ACK5W0_04770 [Labrys sp. (in: a-proteobacteria)]